MKIDILHPPASIQKGLCKATKRSTHSRWMTGCVIVDKNGKIISDGCSHASSFRINSLHSIHAEIHALARGRYKDLSDCIAFVQTIARKSGNTTVAKPCLTCAISLRTAGIKTAVFTVDSKKFEILDLEKDISHLKVYPRRDEIE